MKIAYITAGAAGMYCGSCLHDNTLAAALKRRGHEVVLVPTYTPIRTDETDVSEQTVFFGALNVYLQQKSAVFRHTPWLLNRLLDRPGLLNWVSRKASSTDPHALGEMTVTMLEGEAGNQAGELDRLVDWLEKEHRPDVVHLTNSMFLGLARRMKERLGATVLCSVQGEDIFLAELDEPHRGRAGDLLRRRAAEVDGFVATSRYCADQMGTFLGIPEEKMHLVHLGISTGGHQPTARGESNPFVIGYLARVCPEKGLHLLVQAWHELRRRLGPGRVRLEAAGWLGPRDRAYFEEIQAQVREWGAEDDFHYRGEVDRDQKLAFLQQVDVLSVPTVYREPKGLPVLEALASGVPVVQPDHGAFPELVELTGGGVLFPAGSVPALVEALDDLRRRPDHRRELGRRGRSRVMEYFTDEAMAERTLNLYDNCLKMPAGS